MISGHLPGVLQQDRPPVQSLQHLQKDVITLVVTLEVALVITHNTSSNTSLTSTRM